MCELDTVHIYLKKVPNHVVELVICNLHLLPRAVQAGLVVSGLEPTRPDSLGVMDEQCAWYVEVYVRA